MKYPNAAKGINKIFIAEILSILGAVLALIIAIMAVTNNVDTIDIVFRLPYHFYRPDPAAAVYSITVIFLSGKSA